MSHRLFGPIAGITALTGLALGLACGGGGSEENIPSTQPKILTVSKPQTAISLHRYRLTLTGDDNASKWVVVANPDKGGSLTAIRTEGTVGEWYYYPTNSEAGQITETIEFRAEAKDGGRSDKATVSVAVDPNVRPELPERLRAALINIDTTKPLVQTSDPLPLTMGPGDTDKITWADSGFSGDFIGTGGLGQAEIDPNTGKMTITAPSSVFPSLRPYGPYSLTFTARKTQTSTTDEDYEVPALHSYTINLLVAATGGLGSDGLPDLPVQLTFRDGDYPEDGTEILAGKPVFFPFWAIDKNNSSNLPIKFDLARGTGAPADSWSWIYNNEANNKAPYVTLENNKGNASYDRWRNHQEVPAAERDPIFSFGRAAFVAPNKAADYVLPYKVTASFYNNTGGTSTKDQDFSFLVKRNTPPVVPTGTAFDKITTKVSNPRWNGGEDIVQTGSTAKLVLKGAREGSLDMESTIEFTRMVSDKDHAAGDVLTFKYEGIWVGTAPTVTTLSTNNLKDKFKADYLGGFDPAWAFKHDAKAEEGEFIGQIRFARHPAHGDNLGTTASPNLLKDQNLHFVWSVQDLANPIQLITVTVPVQENKGPVFDNNATHDKEYDKWPEGNSLAKDIPTEGKSGKWEIPWGKSNGTVTDVGAVWHPQGHSVYLEVSKLDISGGKSLIYNSGSLVAPTTGTPPTTTPTGPFTFSWMPTEGRQEYVFLVEAWDQYGVPAVPMTLKGGVFGNIHGQHIDKVIYLDGGTDKKQAKLFPWPIYLDAFDEIKGQYSTELNKPITTTPLPEEYSTWDAYAVPAGRYLVAGGHIVRNNTTNIEVPVIGPAVRSTNLKWGGGDTNSYMRTDNGTLVGNLMPFAYISSTTPDLTTHAGSGKVAGQLDKSLGEDYHGFELDLEPWGAGTPTIIVAMNQIPKDSLDTGKDALQFAFPYIGQKGFFALEPTPILADSYPVGAYPATEGWGGVLGAPTTYSLDYPEGIPNSAYLYGLLFKSEILPYQMTKDDALILSIMKHDKGMYSIDSGKGAEWYDDYPYWRMARIGNVATGSGLEYNGGVSFVADEGKLAATFADATTSGELVGIDRQSFRKALDTLVTFKGTESETEAFLNTVNETMQVLAYSNGTSLGPDNHHGLPTLLEFGDLNKKSGNQPYGGKIEFRGIQIPTLGSNTPVLSYIAKYATSTVATFAGGTGLSGTMGLITQNVGEEVRLDLPPVTDVKISTGPTAKTNISNYYVGSTLTKPGADVSAAGHTAGDGKTKMWLSWTNPQMLKDPADEEEPYEKVPFSGNILEFFRVPKADSGRMYDDNVPHFKVFVSAEVEEFPIPDEWVNEFKDTSGLFSAQAVVRMRTVRYGEYGSASNPMINFNETPYKQALPATWTDTITTRINFGAPVVPTWSATSSVSWSQTTADVSLPNLANGRLVFTSPTDGTSTGASVTPSSVNPSGLTVTGATYTWTVWNAETLGTQIGGAGTATGNSPAALNIANTTGIDGTTTPIYLRGVPTLGGITSTADPLVITVNLQEISDTTTDLFFANYETEISREIELEDDSILTEPSGVPFLTTPGNLVLNNPYYSGSGVPAGYTLVWEINEGESDIIGSADIEDASIDFSSPTAPKLIALGADGFESGDMIAIDVYLEKGLAKTKVTTFYVTIGDA